MESCTGGLLASRFTDTEGASAVFKGSLVTYSNEEKLRHGVSRDIIDEYGVYSSECSQAMAKAAKVYYQTDIAVSITGSTGNIDPNNSGSVTGVAYFSIAIGQECFDYQIVIDVTGYDRKQIKQKYADIVYKQLLDLLKVHQNYTK